MTMLTCLRYSTLQTGLVLFWALWLSIVTRTNVCDALKPLAHGREAHGHP